MDARSVLADRFVPAHLRSVYASEATLKVTVGGAETLKREINSLLSNVHPFSDMPCLCGKSLHDDAGKALKKTVRSVKPFLRFAIESCQRTADTEQTKNTKVPLLPPSNTNKIKSQKVDEISNMQDYVRIFEDLLELEQEEIVLQYEKYSQFDCPVQLLQSHTSQGRETAFASITIEGIADVRPALRVGDIVLIRPIQQVIRKKNRPLKNKKKTFKLHPAIDPATDWTTISESVKTNYVRIQRHVNRYKCFPHDVSEVYALPILSLPKQNEDHSLRSVWEHSFYDVLEVQSQIAQVRRGTTKFATEIHDSVDFEWIDHSTQQLFAESAIQNRFSIRFVPSNKDYERCLTALDWLATLPPSSCTDILFPTAAPLVTIERKKYSQLNHKQSEFVDMVLSRTKDPSRDKVRPPMVLTGPAGTGKTKAMLTAMLEVLGYTNDNDGDRNPEYRILVCTPSHTSADVVTTRLGKYLSKEELFRLYDSDRSQATVKSDLLQFTCQSHKTGCFTLPIASRLLAYKVIVCTCTDAHIFYQAGFTNTGLRERKECFNHKLRYSLPKDYGISVDGSVVGLDEPHFTHLFVDEAAQATEPEILIPFSVVVDPAPGSVKAEVILVGDPRQLSANILSSEAVECGLGRSLLERLLQRPVNCLGGGHPSMLGPKNNTAPNNSFAIRNEKFMDDSQHSFQYGMGGQSLCSFLTLSYRGHPSFLMMPSALFYFDKLESVWDSPSEMKATQQSPPPDYWLDRLRKVEELSIMVTLQDDEKYKFTKILAGVPEIIRATKKQPKWPIHFRGVVGRDVSVALNSFVGSNSWSNTKEATTVVEIVVTLVLDGVPPQSIGIMSPYRAQVVLIRNMLRQQQLSTINVGVIEDYQAVELEVIILSLVRSEEKFIDHDVKRRVGVFRQRQRTNVALTRAVSLLIVVGNPNIMSRDPIWRQWLWFCLRNGFWYGEKSWNIAFDLIPDYSMDGDTSMDLDLNASKKKEFSGIWGMETEASSTSKGANDIVNIGTLERMYNEREA